MRSSIKWEWGKKELHLLNFAVCHSRALRSKLEASVGSVKSTISAQSSPNSVPYGSNRKPGDFKMDGGEDERVANATMHSIEGVDEWKAEALAGDFQSLVGKAVSDRASC